MRSTLGELVSIRLACSNCLRFSTVQTVSPPPMSADCQLKACPVPLSVTCTNKATGVSSYISRLLASMAGRYWVHISVPAPTQSLFLEATTPSSLSLTGVRPLHPLLFHYTLFSFTNRCKATTPSSLSLHPLLSLQV